MDPAPMILPGCELSVKTPPPLSPSPFAAQSWTLDAGLAQLFVCTAYQRFTQTPSLTSKMLWNDSTWIAQWTPVQAPDVHTRRPARFEATPATGLKKSCASATPPS